jgi:hypothetical protein
MMVLQNNTNLKNVLEGPYGETYAARHDGDQAVNVKTEEVSGTEEEVDHVPIAVQKIKAESEVSCMSLLGR